MLKLLKNQSGAIVLMLTVLILASTFIVTLTVSEIVRNGLLMGSTQFHSTQAYFAAEAGAEKILWELFVNDYRTYMESASCQTNRCVRWDSMACSPCNNPNTLYGLSKETSFSVQKLGASPIILRIEGYYRDKSEQRVIKLEI